MSLANGALQHTAHIRHTTGPQEDVRSCHLSLKTMALVNNEIFLKDH